jgi:hypothetical protein
MAKYAILIYGDAKQWDSMTPEQSRAHDAAHVRFREAAGSTVIGGAELQFPSMATTLRAGSGDGFTTTDGPFLEIKEGLGGFYMMEADDLDQVIKLASLLPEVHAGHSGVEIRPVVERE